MSLQPLNGGVIVLVGVKASNLDEEIRTHPRVVMWDSQQQHWTDKELPANTRAVFCTRFIGHDSFHKIMSQVRKRHITMFRPEGTGMIVKQVKELLGLNKPEPVMVEITKGNFAEETKEPETIMPEKKYGKLVPLYQFIDFSKNNAENARSLLAKAQEMNISTTHASLVNLVKTKREKRNLPSFPRGKRTELNRVTKSVKEVDVSVTLLDGVIKELTDVRDYLVKTVDENRKLKTRIDKFKQMIEGD